MTVSPVKERIFFVESILIQRQGETVFITSGLTPDCYALSSLTLSTLFPVLSAQSNVNLNWLGN